MTIEFEPQNGTFIIYEDDETIQDIVFYSSQMPSNIDTSLYPTVTDRQQRHQIKAIATVRPIRIILIPASPHNINAVNIRNLERQSIMHSHFEKDGLDVEIRDRETGDVVTGKIFPLPPKRT